MMDVNVKAWIAGVASEASAVRAAPEERAVEAKPEPTRLAEGAQAKRFMLAGKARVTLVSQKTGARFTCRVGASKDGAVFFVSVLTGQDNDADYQFLGTIFPSARVQIGASPLGRVYGNVPAVAPRFVHGKKSRIGTEAPSAKAFAWAWASIAKGELPPSCEVHHEGSCGKCGRALTVPESIACGLGPKCRGGGLIMGGCTFWTEAEGETARVAFDAAVKEARYQHGHGGYSGTIAEKRSFVSISVPDGKTASDYAGELLDNDDERVSDKWGPAGCIKLAAGRWLFFGWASS